MERDTANHPGPSAGNVNVTWDSLSDEQRAALTPEQREQLQHGSVAVDPRSPLLADGESPDEDDELDGDVDDEPVTFGNPDDVPDEFRGDADNSGHVLPDAPE
jgi:hypothetical protein